MMRQHVLCTTALALLAGCQSYTPQPLDSAAHRALWAERDLDSGNLRAFAERLGTGDAGGAGGTGVYDPSDGLSLDEAGAVALTFNPTLRAARAQAAVALAGAENAGLWDDPSLSVDVMHVTESTPDPWIIGGVLGFTVPLSGRLPVEKSKAAAEHELQLRRVVESEWTTLAALRTAWIDWSASRLRADLVRQLIERVDAIVGIVERLEEAGSLSRFEGRLFRMERAARRTELLLLESRSQEVELEVKSLMGLVPDAPVTLHAAVSVAAPQAVDDGFIALEERSPALAARRAEYELAEESLNLEIRKQYPDLSIGPAYEWDEGQNKIGLGAGVILPILNANRQGIAVARAARDAARIEYEAEHERLLSRYRRAQRQYAAAAAALEQVEGELVPLAEAQIADERRLAAMGELDTLLTLESVRTAHETRVRLIDARVATARAAILLHELLGWERSAAAAEEQP